MAAKYCKRCGAYIPDGKTTCLACGFDEEAELRQANESLRSSVSGGKTSDGGGSSSQAAQRDYYAEIEEKRRKAEERRAVQQEQSREWARTEQKKREAQAKSSAASKSAAARKSSGRADSTEEVTSAKKLASMASYVSVGFLIPYLVYPGDRFARFHAKQGLVLFAAGIAAKLVLSVLGLRWIATLARILLAIEGVSNAANGRKAELSFIGKFASRIGK